MNLAGRNILLGITGGIAAYKSAELLRLLKKNGANVQVVMTKAAQAFVTPMTLQALSGNPVRTALFDLKQESAMGHIDLARWADTILVAPATANMLSQILHGEASDLLTTLILAAEVPVAVAPAMNQAMWSNAATQANISKLKTRGIQVWGPASGEQACGETGQGRMLEPEQLLARLIKILSHGPLQGLKVMVTAGPTHEPIDPVRYIGNRSSGKMGFQLAQAFVNAGAQVLLVAGPVNLETPRGVFRIDVQTANEMHQAVESNLKDCDIFVACAAVADYRLETVSDQKIKKGSEKLTLQLVANVDILASVGQIDNGPYTVGFAAETQNLVEFASKKRKSKRIDMIAANLVGAEEGGFGAETNALTVIWEDGQKELPMADKSILARQLVAMVSQQYLEDRVERTEKTT